MSNRSLQGWGREGSRACASHHKGPTARAAPAAATFSMGGPGSRVEMHLYGRQVRLCSGARLALHHTASAHADTALPNSKALQLTCGW